MGLEIKVEVATAKFRTRSETFAETQADVLEEAVNRVQALPTVAKFGTPDMQSLLNQVLIIYFLLFLEKKSKELLTWYPLLFDRR